MEKPEISSDVIVANGNKTGGGERSNERSGLVLRGGKGMEQTRSEKKRKHIYRDAGEAREIVRKWKGT